VEMNIITEIKEICNCVVRTDEQKEHDIIKVLGIKECDCED
jgi:hypothetical protein